jgi:Tol biopolymer transport system component
MKPPVKFNPLFDKFLLGGLGAGLIILCILMASFLVIWQNPPRPRSTGTPLAVGDPSTITPGPSPTPLFQFASPTLLPPGFTTATPLQSGTLAPTEVIPTAVPQFSGAPPTGLIVFTCFINQIDQICLMNADGTGRKQLTDFTATSFYASIAPDGETIYFSSRKSGVFDIYSINIRGKALKHIRGGLGSLYAPERSPTDERIVFTNETGGTQQIWVMRPDGKNPHAVTKGPEDIDPTYSPDGMFIAFASARTGQRQLYVMDRDGSEVRQITKLPDMGGRSSWSPGSRKLAFYAGPNGDRDIYVINADGTGLTRLTNGGDNLGPSWSPDGEWIAFTSFRDGNNEIYIMRADGSDVTRLTYNASSDWQPRWGD